MTNALRVGYCDGCGGTATSNKKYGPIQCFEVLSMLQLRWPVIDRGIGNACSLHSTRSPLSVPVPHNSSSRYVAGPSTLC
jgi:hypothetical protein